MVRIDQCSFLTLWNKDIHHDRGCSGCSLTKQSILEVLPFVFINYAALWAADLDWIVRLVHFGVSRSVPPALSSDWRGVTTDLSAGVSKNATNAGSQLTF